MATNPAQSKRLQQILKGWPKKIFSDLHSKVVGIVCGLVIGTGGIAAVSKTVWKLLKNTFQQSMPIWLLLLILIAIWVYYELLIRRYSRSISQKSKYKTEIIEVPETFFKWRVTHNSGVVTNIDDIPFCKKCDIQFIYSDDKYVCPNIYYSKCKRSFYPRELDFYHRFAKSFIEKIVRDSYKK
jgi:hypothetical protein